MALTPEFIEGSFWFVLFGYVLALAFQLYMLYLNWKQSKVNNQMGDLLNEVKEIRNLLEKKKKNKK